MKHPHQSSTIRQRLHQWIFGSSGDSEPKRGRLLLETLERRQLLAGDMELLFTEGTAASETQAAQSQAAQTQAAQTGGLRVTSQAEGELAPDLVQFAKDLADAGVQFFGAHWCPACTDQKELFDDGKDDLPFIEVTNPDRSLNAVGVAENISQFPTWDFPDGTRRLGVLSLNELSTLSGVSIPQSEQPTFEPIGDLTVEVGSPLHVPIDVYDPDGGPQTVTVSVDDPSLLTATVLSGNRSIRIDMATYGDMVFELFEQRAPVASGRVADLAEADFYDGIIFHRVVDDFVIQAGDPTGTGTSGSNLGTFDDDFHPDLQHNREGILSFAKSTDDTNNSQFFITEVDTRFLDFNHSIFGQLVEGFDVREAISETSTPSSEGTGSSQRPDNDVTIETIEVFNDTENSVVMLKANGSATGTTNVTFTVTDQDGNTHSETVTVTVIADTANGQPFLGPVTPPTSTTGGTPSQLQLTSIDVENDPVKYFAQTIDNPTAGSVSLDLITSTFDPNRGESTLTINRDTGFSGTVEVQLESLATSGQQVTYSAELLSGSQSGSVSVDPTTGLVTVTPNSSFSGNLRVRVGARDAQQSVVRVYAESISNTAIGSVSLDPDTGASTVSAGAGFEGTMDVLFGVAPGAGVTGNGFGDSDLQLVSFPFEGEAVLAPTSIDLDAASDSGVSDTDNITNEGSLTFQVGGVTSGATVELINVATGNAIGSGVATGTTISITTNNIAALGDNTYQIAARQSSGGDTSSLSSPLTLVYDTTAPDSVADTALTTGNALRLYESDLISGEEGSGLSYALTNAPTGATIDPITGLVSWRPTEAQQGDNDFTVTLTDVAGNVRTDTFTVAVAGQPLAEIRLETTDLQGTPISTIAVGQTFLLRFVGVDTRRIVTPGVFAAYADVLFDSTLVRPEPGSAITYSEEFPLVRKGTFSNGLIDELGAVSDSLVATNLEESLIATVRMETLATGTVNIRTEPADDVNSEVLLYLNDDQIPAEEVAYGSVILAIGQNFTIGNDSFTVAEDSGATTLDVLANDTIVSGGGSLSVVSVEQPATGGTVTLEGGTVSFTPSADFNGQSIFTYRVSDSGGVQENGTVAISVTSVNDPPDGVDDTFNVNQNSTDNVLDVLANDSIAPDTGETLTVTDVSATTPNGGTVSISSGGQSIVYTPAADFTGTDTLTYTVSDGSLTDLVDVTLTVAPADNPPTANDDAFTVTEDDSEAAFDVLSNDTRDVDNQAFVIDSVGSPSEGGTARASSDGSQFFYTPAADFFGTEEVTYTIRDTGGGLAVGTVTFTVTGVNDAPPINNPTVGLNRGGGEQSVFQLSDLPDNVDSGETLSISTVSTTTSAGGSARIDATTGAIFYTPPSGDFTGEDTIDFTIADGSGLTSSGVITINVSDFQPRSVFLSLPSMATRSRVSGVRLTGTNLLGESVSVPIQYNADSAVFADLLPGEYMIEIPAIPFLLNAETARQIPVSSLADDGDATIDAEIGRLRPEFISIQDFLGSAPTKSLLVAVAPGESHRLSMPSSTADTVEDPVIELDSGGENLTIRGTRTTTDSTTGETTAEDIQATLPTISDRRVQLRGQVDDLRLFRVSVEDAEVTFNSTTAGGEGEATTMASQDDVSAPAAILAGEATSGSLTLGGTQAEGEAIAAITQADLFVPVTPGGSSRTDATVLRLGEGDLWLGDTLIEGSSQPSSGSDGVDEAMQSVTEQLSILSAAADEVAEKASSQTLRGEAIDAALRLDL